MTEKLNWIGIFFVTLVGYLCYFTVVVIESILSIFVSPKNGESSLPFFHTRFLPTDLKMEMNWDAIRVKDEHAAKAFITSAPVESTTTHVADSLPLEQFILILTPISLEMRSSLDCYARAIYTIKLEMTPSESRIAQSIQDARLASWFLSPSNLLRTSTRPKCLAPINALSAPQFKWLLSYSTASPHMYLFLSNQYCIEVFSLNEGKKICKWRHDELFGLKDGSGTAPDADSKLFVVQMQYVSGGHLILLLNDAQLYVVDVERMMSKAQSLNSNSNVESHLFLFDDMFHTDASVGCGKSKAKQCVLSFHVDVPGRTLYYVTVPKGTINEHVCPTTPASCAPILRAYKFPSTWFNKNVIPSLDNQFHPVISTPSAQFHSRRLIDATQMMTHNNSFLAHLSSSNHVLISQALLSSSPHHSMETKISLPFIHHTPQQNPLIPSLPQNHLKCRHSKPRSLTHAIFINSALFHTVILTQPSYIPPEKISDYISLKYLQGKTALITGSSRGIGLNVAKKLALAGANVIVTGKSIEERPNLPGTIYSAAKEIENECVSLEGQRIVPMQLDVTKDDSIQILGNDIEKHFGKIDILVNNSGALWWKNIGDTPMKRADLVMDVNFRGSFAMTQMLLERNLIDKGYFVTMSPPVDHWKEMVPGKAFYTVSKLGMTMLQKALAEEYPGRFATYALWPKTLIESFATINFKIGDRSQWRRADILGDAVLCMVCEPIKGNQFSGEAFIDEDFLRQVGVNDFKVYRCDPEVEPDPMPFSEISRGHVNESP
eukprot:CAMPEP_0117447714 /NCGR_PEP_ID=MMETSP0759-20121206/7021_1 /TAXON_ID=63605 /ORGANISM="Percolomonas cosmopolitus, Strain WS" /LENGTH=774 /DNA_ID=CAMNT_0005240065 /DNA_START=386 /DNA_END=2711 /DNA_ORIENTATION=-